MDDFEKKKNETTEEMTDEKGIDGEDRMQEYRHTATDGEQPAESRKETNRSEEETEIKESAKTDPDHTDPDHKEEPELLRDELAAAKNEAAEFRDRFLRVCADLENYKKQSQRRMEDFKKFTHAEFIKDLLPAIDNLERAIDSFRNDRATTQSCMAEGVEMTLSEILTVLKKYNVTPIEAHGKPFDPNYHDAVMQEASDSHPDNTVKKELQKGYLLHDRLIRPSMVVVSKGSASDKK